MFTVSLTEYALIAVYFLALERFVTAKEIQPRVRFTGTVMHLQTRPCSACVHFHEAPPYVKVFSPQPITQIALSIVYLDIAYPSLLFNLRIRLASNADIINTLEFSMLVLTCV